MHQGGLESQRSGPRAGVGARLSRALGWLGRGTATWVALCLLIGSPAALSIATTSSVSASRSGTSGPGGVWYTGPGLIGDLAGLVPGGQGVADAIHAAHDGLEVWGGANEDSWAYRISTGAGFAAGTLASGGAGAVGKLAAMGAKGTERLAAMTAERAATGAGHGAGDLLAACRANSFSPGTRVLMADGTTLAIQDVEVGDLVAAADPETGQRGDRAVTDTIVGTGVKDLVVVATETGTVTATAHHPFWSTTRSAWTDAADLEPGDRLQLPDGTTLAVTSTSRHSATTTVHNLTIDQIHTYYVLIGTTPTLVHNCALAAEGGSRIAANAAAGNAARDALAVAHPGSLIEQSLKTTMGLRRLDVLTQSGLGIESKVGRASLTLASRSQIAKDSLLLGNGDVTSIEWVFSRSGVTGQIGPTRPLADALGTAGIPWSLVP